MRRFLAFYGAHPLHLLALLTSFALASYAAVRLVPHNPVGVAVWFVGAAVGHDILLFPLYAIVDTGLARTWRRHRGSGALPRAPWINYVRVPLALSGLLLLVYSPLILQLTDIYAGTTGMSLHPYLERWLLITAVLFGLSAFGYAIRLRGIRRR